MERNGHFHPSREEGRHSRIETQQDKHQIVQLCIRHPRLMMEAPGLLRTLVFQCLWLCCLQNTQLLSRTGSIHDCRLPMVPASPILWGLLCNLGSHCQRFAQWPLRASLQGLHIAQLQLLSGMLPSSATSLRDGLNPSTTAKVASVCLGD